MTIQGGGECKGGKGLQFPPFTRTQDTSYLWCEPFCGTTLVLKTKFCGLAALKTGPAGPEGQKTSFFGTKFSKLLKAQLGDLKAKL